MYTYLMQKPDYISPAIPYVHAQHQRERIGVSLRNWIQSGLQQWKRQKMVAALEALDDRLLLDIGIPRHKIGKAVTGLEDRDLDMGPMASSTEWPKAKEALLVTA